MGIIEDRASSHGEVVLAFGTVELLVSLNPRNALTEASRAFDATGPAQFSQNFSASFVGVEQTLNI
jgi:hypothetical protein